MCQPLCHDALNFFHMHQDSARNAMGRVTLPDALGYILDIPLVYPPHPVTVTNEALGWDSLLKLGIILVVTVTGLGHHYHGIVLDLLRMWGIHSGVGGSRSAQD